MGGSLGRSHIGCARHRQLVAGSRGSRRHDLFVIAALTRMACRRDPTGWTFEEKLKARDQKRARAAGSWLTLAPLRPFDPFSSGMKFLDVRASNLFVRRELLVTPLQRRPHALLPADR